MIIQIFKSSIDPIKGVDVERIKAFFLNLNVNLMLRKRKMNVNYIALMYQYKRLFTLKIYRYEKFNISNCFTN